MKEGGCSGKREVEGRCGESENEGKEGGWSGI